MSWRQIPRHATQTIGLSGYKMIGVEATPIDKGDAPGGAAIIFRQHLHVSAFSPLPGGHKQLA